MLHEGLGKDAIGIIEFHAARLSLPVEFREIAMPAHAYPVFGHISRAAYLRLELPRAVPEARIVLYLDVDLLVLGRLRELLLHPLGDVPLAAVRDAEYPVVGVSDALPGWQSFGIPPDQEYFNSGVMLLDLAECGRQGIFEAAYRFLAEHPANIRYWDQDALNWAARDKWARLPYRWNTHAVSPRIEAGDFVYRGSPGIPVDELLAHERRAAVLHFAGPFKPWREDYPPGWPGDVYRQYLKTVVGYSPELTRPGRDS
jgi:UDP-D-galactose:(glucosyl)LPS alpha-1,3-D-galactosyltransferase